MKLRMHPGTCGDCGGSANWTIIHGVMHYFCIEQCDGFRQLDLDLRDQILQGRADLDRHGASLKGSQSLDRLETHHPTLGPAPRPQSPTPPSEGLVPGSRDPRQLRLQDTTDESRARLEQLGDLGDRDEPVLPWCDDPK